MTSYSYSRTTTYGPGGRTVTTSGNLPRGAGPGFSLFGPGGRLNFGGGSSGGGGMPPRGGIRSRPGPSARSGTGEPSSSGGGSRPGAGGVQAFNRRSVKPGPPLPSANYDAIKAECLANGTLWEDPDFPADYRSISSRKGFESFEWKRPGELCDDPQFFVGGGSRFDVKQGKLGDCWLLAAVASLTLEENLLHRVCPPEQSFTDEYAGIFKFHFWHQGEWIEVCVDDQLPSSYGQLVFLQSDTKNEFWSALLEKAYAKLQGNYENLKGGNTLEAMEDFTGGVGENFTLNDAPSNLFSIMLKAHARNSLMGCAIEVKGGAIEDQLPNGLVIGHAYSITDVKQTDIRTPRMDGQIQMVRIRNPWGTAEWNGAWSDKSREWGLVSDEEREELGLTFSDDGEFWMSFDDFMANFSKIEICNLGPDSISEDEAASGKKRFDATCEHGAWVRRVNAGGCRNYLETFWTNPQFRVTLTDPDDDDDDDLCTLIVALLQKDRRKKRSQGLDLLTIGYVIYQLKEEDNCSGPLEKNFFKYNASCAKSPSFVNMREVCGRHKLSPGTYAIVPSSFEPNEEADFLIRIYSEKANVMGEMDEETGISNVQPTEPEPTPEDDAQDEALRGSFERIAGEDMEIDAYELREILNVAFQKDFEFDGFSLETARSMVAMMDVDRSGKLGFQEFKTLWNKTRTWKGAFKEYDADGSGQLNSYELRKALGATGFRLSNETLATLVFRYSRRDGNIPFDDFVLCAVRLGHMIDIFKAHEIEKGVAEFSLDDFIQTTLYS